MREKTGSFPLAHLVIAAVTVLLTASGSSAVQIQIGKFKPYAHGLRTDTVTLLDARRVWIQNIYYDGTGPDAWFSLGLREPPGAPGTWSVSIFPKERDDLSKNPKIPDENESCAIVKKYTGQSIILTLPDGLTWADVDYLSLYCYKYQHNFGYIKIPTSLYSLNPYLNTYGILRQVNYCK